MFNTLTDSFPHVQVILDADKAAVAGREFYDDEYFAPSWSADSSSTTEARRSKRFRPTAPGTLTAT